jgi:hypothetical protein
MVRMISLQRRCAATQILSITLVKIRQHLSHLRTRRGDRQLLLLSSLLATTLVGCTTTTTDQYDATAQVTYTWQVEYSTDPGNLQRTRKEDFASVSLVNRNGQRPDDGVTRDDRGLWLPAVPPRPTVEEIEARKRTMERVGTPQLLQQVEYQLTFEADGETKTLPTDYSVYRQAVQAHANGDSLNLTLGVGDATVEKAEPQ